MATNLRQRTKYPGVFFREARRLGGNGVEKVFYVLIRKGGKLIEEKVGRQFADNMTEAKANNIRSERLEGRRESRKAVRERIVAEKEALESRPTLIKLWEAYEAQRPATRSSGIDGGRFQKHIAPVLGDKVPAELVTLDADRLRMKLLKTHSPQTAKHVLALLKRVIMFGVRAGMIDPPSPKRFNIKMPSFDNQKTETLSDEQLCALLQAAAADENLKAGALIRLALATGLRKSEMLRLCWRDIDCDAGFITLPRTKSGKVQRIPLNDMAREVLAGLPRVADHVFPGGKEGEHVQNLYPALRRIRERAGLPPTMRPLHAWRHVYASRLASAGESLYVVQKLLRHSDGRMTARYSHLADETLRRASDTAGTIMQKAQDSGEVAKVVNLEDFKKG